jgi:hypothetical protein
MIGLLYPAPASNQDPVLPASQVVQNASKYYITANMRSLFETLSRPGNFISILKN